MLALFSVANRGRIHSGQTLKRHGSIYINKAFKEGNFNRDSCLDMIQRQIRLGTFKVMEQFLDLLLLLMPKEVKWPLLMEAFETCRAYEWSHETIKMLLSTVDNINTQDAHGKVSVSFFFHDRIDWR